MTKSDTPGLTLYSRTGCHLCEDMIAVLRDLAEAPGSNSEGNPGSTTGPEIRATDSVEYRWQDHRYSLRIVDIDHSAELAKRFNVLVPALYLGEQEICHHFLDLVSLKRVLDDFRKFGATNG